MTVEEIFATNPDLLKADEVQKLIEYVKEKHSLMYQLIQHHKSFHDKVLDVTINSELIVIGGEPSKEAIRKIWHLLDNPNL